MVPLYEKIIGERYNAYLMGHITEEQFIYESEID